MSDAIYNAVQPYMAAQAWNGEDITMSAVALTQAVDAMAERRRNTSLTNCPPAGSGEDAGVEEPGRAVSRCSMYLMLQTSSPYEKWEKLEARAETISQKQDCGVYFALVE